MLYTTYLLIFCEILNTINVNIKNGINKLSENLEFKLTITDACAEINDVFGPGLLALVSVAGVETFYTVFLFAAHGMLLRECVWSLFVLNNLFMIVHTASKVTNEVFHILGKFSGVCVTPNRNLGQNFESDLTPYHFFYFNNSQFVFARLPKRLK